MRLYKAGKSDTEIGRELHASVGAVGRWRKTNDLPVQKPRTRRTWDVERAMELYNEGLSDDLIGEQVGTTAQAIHNWRNSQKLPPHPRKRWSRDKARDLLNEGYSDAEIAKALGTTTNAITCWRFGGGVKTAAAPRWDVAKGRALYEQGMTDRKIAKEIGVSAKTFGDWRRRNKLPANRVVPSGPTRKWDTEKAQELFEAGYSDQEIAESSKDQILVRLMAPTEYGTPLQIWCFTSTNAWTAYEAIQSALFEHITVTAPLFGLNIYVYSSGQDALTVNLLKGSDAAPASPSQAPSQPQV